MFTQYLLKSRRIGPGYLSQILSRTKSLTTSGNHHGPYMRIRTMDFRCSCRSQGPPVEKLLDAPGQFGDAPREDGNAFQTISIHSFSFKICDQNTSSGLFSKDNPIVCRELNFEKFQAKLSRSLF